MTERVFVGRRRELRQLGQFLNLSLEGSGQVCLVTGEAGSGKTALCDEFCQRIQESHSELLVSVGSCNAQTGVGDPYLPFREVLGVLTGDVEAKVAKGTVTATNARRLRSFLAYSGQAVVEFGPDLVGLFVPGGKLAAKLGTFVLDKVGWLERLEKLTKREPLAPGKLEQSRLFEQYTAVLQAMAKRQPLVLLLDDLQWADDASISLLFHLGRNIGQHRILLIGTYRANEVALGRGGKRHPLDKVLTEFKRYGGDVTIDLDRSDERQAREFVNAFLDSEPNRMPESFRQALFERTEGHPLFTIELLREMQERGDLVRDDAGRWIEDPSLDWANLPARVEGVIEERIGRLEAELRDILSVASIEGQEFTAQVIARVEKLQERRLLHALSQELEKRHHLVREQEEAKVGRQFLSRYQFAHALFQQYLYRDLGAGERRLLHREIAPILEELYRGHTEEITIQLARHYTEAAEGEKAVKYLIQAGDRARNLYAYGEAISYYEQALLFLKEQGACEQTARTLMKLGLTYHIAFAFQQARQAYEEGFGLWQMVGKAASPVSLSPAPHALRVGWPYPPLTLDPALAADVDSVGVIDCLFSGLVALTPDMEVVPDVARSWEVLEDGRTYLFHLRDDACWSDGRPVTAQDFVYAWRRILDPATGSPSATMLYDIRGARAFHRSESSDPDSVGVRDVDETTLLVELQQPTGYFLHLLAHTTSRPVPRQRVELLGAAWSEARPLVSNGPFRLESWRDDGTVYLAREPMHHSRPTGNVERVELQPIGDTSARLEAYASGDLDVMFLWNMPGERDQARQRHARDYVSAPWLATNYVGFNVSQPPFDDRRVRRAFALSLDRERWADEVMDGYFFPATGGLVPPGMPGHSAGIGLPYEPEEGRRLLAKAGYPDGRGFPRVTLRTDEGKETMSEYIASQWQQNLNVQLAHEVVSWEDFYDGMEHDPPHIFVGGWSTDYPDPDNLLRVCEGLHWTRWQDDAFQQLVARARQSTDQSQRIQMYLAADRLLVEEAVLLPFAYLRTHLLVKPWVTRLPTSAIKWWYWQDAVLEPHQDRR